MAIRHQERALWVLAGLTLGCVAGCADAEPAPWSTAPVDTYTDAAGLADTFAPPPRPDAEADADGIGIEPEVMAPEVIAPPVCTIDADCDDGLLCTDDSCGVDSDGEAMCEHQPVVCVGPEEPCLETACDAVTGCESGLLASELCCFDAVLDQRDFELPGDEVAVDLTLGSILPALWHRSDARAFTGQSSYLFAVPDKGDFDNGELVAGRLTLPASALPADTRPELRFHVWPDVEEGDAWDLLIVHVDDGSGAVPVWSKAADNLVMAQWNSILVDLSAFAGTSVWISFTFNSIDHTVNDGEGVYIDDVWVWTGCQASTCSSVETCDDDLHCTDVACIDGLCAYAPVESCCVMDSDCKDGDHCTTDTCVDGVCTSAPQTGTDCCNTTEDCDDDNPCTTDLCVPGDQYVCEHQAAPSAGCCVSEADCEDDNPRTVDGCVEANCVHQATCCLFDEDCDDDDPCTHDVCVDEACSVTYTLADGCCDVAPHAATFETGAEGWTFAGGAQGCSWHVQADAESTSGTHALHYGDPFTSTYACGASAGVATSPTIALPGGVRLTLASSVWMDVDSGTNLDLLSLWLVSAQGEFELWHKTSGFEMEQWHTLSTDLSAFGGTEVSLSWRFDTVNGVSNDGVGVFVDDVLLSSPCAPATCSTSADCNDDLAFTVHACEAGLCSWTF